MTTLVFTKDSTNQTSTSYNFDYAAIFFSSTAELVGVVATILLIDRTGRMATQSVLYVIGGIMVFGMCWLANEQQDNNNDDKHRNAMIGFAFLARMCVMGGAQLTWIITAELIPTQLRTSGHSMASAIARLGGATVPWLASPENSFQTMAIAMACIGLYTGTMVCTLPETAGRSLGTARKLASGSYDTKGNPIDSSTRTDLV